MKRVIGFALLCISIGMLVILVIPATSFWCFCLFAGCLLAGYWLFCK